MTGAHEPRLRPATATAGCRRELARELLGDLRRVDARLKANKIQVRDALAATGSTLTQVHGLGVVLATKLLGHVGAVGRFPRQDHFASNTATALGSILAATASSTPPCTPSRSAKPATRDPAAATTCASSAKARPQPRPAERSSDAWPTSSTGASSPTNADTNQPPLDLQKNPSQNSSTLSAFGSAEGAGGRLRRL
jgi:hypothetical protein